MIRIKDHNKEVESLKNHYNSHPHYLDQSRPRMGKTTRIIDVAIQELFRKGRVEVRDHERGRSKQERLLKVLLQRLQMEHGIRRESLNYEIKDNNIIISIKPKPKGSYKIKNEKIRGPIV